ncbi:MAG: WXG100 family type VII secretion target [Segniliparus sp.]|uniref:WXG100 family type VII secretion target n=1 Tax=Segniliparus sp. TaxID=2804064 RepID=UPI003F3AF371
MGGKFKIDLEGLLAKVARMQEIGQRAEEACAEIDAKVSALHQTWTGGAADAHRGEHEQWKQGAQEMHDALKELKSLAEKAHGDYSRAVETNTKMWG